MSIYLGDYAANSTVTFPLTTHDKDGGAIAPSTAFEAADLKIYKGNSATERSSASGVTMTSPFDSIAGLHMIAIDLSDDTDAGFYATGNDYHVILSPDETVDGETVVRHVATFSIARALAATHQAASNAALVANKLDHLVAVAESDDPVDGSILARLASDDGDWSGFVPADDSLEAIRDRGDTGWQTASGFATAVKLLAYVQLLARKDAAIAADRPTEVAEINADQGTGAGTYANTTDSQEALRDRGDAAWVTATSVTATLANGAHGGAAASLTLGGGATFNLVGNITGTLSTVATLTNWANGSTFTNIPWNGAWDVEVQSECADALTAYGVSTYAGGPVASVTGNVGGNVAGSVGSLVGFNVTGTGLSAIPWNAAWDAEVQSECTDALTAYGPATNAQLVARTRLATEYFLAVSYTAPDNPSIAAILTRTDVATSTRLAAASYTAPPSAAAVATQVDTALSLAHGAGNWEGAGAAPTTAQIVTAIKADDQWKHILAFCHGDIENTATGVYAFKNEAGATQFTATLSTGTATRTIA